MTFHSLSNLLVQFENGSLFLFKLVNKLELSIGESFSDKTFIDLGDITFERDFSTTLHLDLGDIG